MFVTFFTFDVIEKCSLTVARCILWISGKKNRLFHWGWESKCWKNGTEQVQGASEESWRGLFELYVTWINSYHLFIYLFTELQMFCTRYHMYIYVTHEYYFFKLFACILKVQCPTPSDQLHFFIKCCETHAKCSESKLGIWNNCRLLSLIPLIWNTAPVVSSFIIF